MMYELIAIVTTVTHRHVDTDVIRSAQPTVELCERAGEEIKSMERDYDANPRKAILWQVQISVQYRCVPREV